MQTTSKGYEIKYKQTKQIGIYFRSPIEKQQLIFEKHTNDINNIIDKFKNNNWFYLLSLILRNSNQIYFAILLIFNKDMNTNIKIKDNVSIYYNQLRSPIYFKRTKTKVKIKNTMNVTGKLQVLKSISIETKDMIFEKSKRIMKSNDVYKCKHNELLDTNIEYLTLKFGYNNLRKDESIK